MYFIIYKTTNTKNGKFYIGYHSTEDINDQYLGSGKILKQAINKEGIENFTKEILYVFPNKEEALAKEKEIVNEEFLKRDDIYNIKCGGEGGWDHTWKDQRRIDAIRESFKNGKSKGWPISDEQRSLLGKKGFKGKKHKEETKKQIRNKLTMDQEEYERRLNDYLSIDKSYGWMMKLAKKWEVSHTQVKRFVDKIK